MARKQKRRKKLGHVQHDILEHLTLGDMLYAHLLSARSTKRYYRLARERARERYQRKQIIDALAEIGYIERDGEYVSITGQGLEAFDATVHRTRKLLETEIWDGKWRIVAYDIPERYAFLRYKLRSVLKRAGFIKLQHSIWIFPHECAELTQLIREEHALRRFVFWGEMNSLGNDAPIKKHFHLS